MRAVPPSSLTQLIPPCGDIPLAAPTESTSNTTFFTRSNADYNDYGALEWRITNINPTGDISTTGSITIDTGILDWQPGFTGSFDVEVRPISCSDGTFGDWASSSYTITPTCQIELKSGLLSQTIEIGESIQNIDFMSNDGCSTKSLGASGYPAGLVWSQLSSNGYYNGEAYRLAGTPTSAGVYTFIVSNSLWGGTQVVTGTITVTDQPKIYFENGTCMCPNVEVGDTATISGTVIL